MKEVSGPSGVDDGVKLVDVKDVAKMLKCGWRTVYRLADTGEFPRGFKVGSLRRWDASQIETWVRERLA